jgi:hypothetical protein
MNSESAERQAGENRLPPSVVEKTRKQIEDYLGKADFKGVPLLDPTVDWDAQSNWPNRFVYQGKLYQLEISDVSGDEIRTLRSKAEVRPGRTVSFGYRPVTQGPVAGTAKVIYPRASWSKDRNRASGKILIWGDGEFFGVWKEVFSYRFYPAGSLHKFHWQARDSDEGQWEVFDKAGKSVGLVASKAYFWNGAKVSQETFERLSQALYESGGVPGAPPPPSGAQPNVPPRR